MRHESLFPTSAPATFPSGTAVLATSELDTRPS